MLRQLLSIAIVFVLTAICAADDADPSWIARSQSGMVASDSPQASEIGAEILKSGGNAFDAAVATSFALGVARPYSTGIGGGGFMVAYIAKEKKFVALDFREMAPAKASLERYAKLREANPDAISPSIIGPDAVGVPGLLAGLGEIHSRFGSKPWKNLVLPAARLAQTGVTIDDSFHSGLRHIEGVYERHPEIKKACPQLGQLFLPDGKVLEIGDKSRNPVFAKTLMTIADSGPKVFYEGPMAQAIINTITQADGIMTAEDLKAYKVIERKPVIGMYNGYTVVSMPPPSSGGVAIVETLNVLEAKCNSLPTEPNPLEHMHLRIEAMKHAFADRARWLGDPDFADIPVSKLTSKAYAQTLADKISMTQASEPEAYGLKQLPDDHGTSHFCVADKEGNIVSITETINGGWGSFVVVEPYGIILNNEMDDFATEADKPNMFGLIQGEANLVGPGKRPLSSMSPTIILKDGKPILTLGASGGPRIISSTLNVALNVLDVHLPLHAALASVRVHHQWQPNEVFFDRTPVEEALESIKKLGHKIATYNSTGVVQAIQFLTDGTMVGGSDPRKGGEPRGVR